MLESRATPQSLSRPVVAVTLVGQACKPDLRLFLEAEVSIKFVCRCGKHLRARDEMASLRSRCPRCGEPLIQHGVDLVVGVTGARPRRITDEVRQCAPLVVGLH